MHKYNNSVPVNLPINCLPPLYLSSTPAPAIALPRGGKGDSPVVVPYYLQKCRRVPRAVHHIMWRCGGREEEIGRLRADGWWWWTGWRHALITGSVVKPESSKVKLVLRGWLLFIYICNHMRSSISNNTTISLNGLHQKTSTSKTRQLDEVFVASSCSSSGPPSLP